MAAQIILRTSDIGGSCNEKEWTDTVHDMAGIQPWGVSIFSGIGNPSYSDYCTRHGIITEVAHGYLRNEQIWSSWIGGPHGWCDWEGNIGCNTYNIGKYPDVKKVKEEWEQVAKAFPTLSLRAQLIDQEICMVGECEWKPLVEFVVSEGRVTVVEPQEPIVQPNASYVDTQPLFGNDQGCDHDQFQKALDLTRITDDDTLTP